MSVCMCVCVCMYMSVCVCVCICVCMYMSVCVVKATEIPSGSKPPEKHTVSLTAVTTLQILSSEDEPGGAVRRETGRRRRQTCRASLQSLRKPSPQTQADGGDGAGDAGPGKAAALREERDPAPDTIWRRACGSGQLSALCREAGRVSHESQGPGAPRIPREARA